MTVAILGAAMTRFGEHDEWVVDLLQEAGSDCLSDGGVEPTAVEHLYVSNMASGELEGQTGVMNALAAELGVIPAYAERVDQTSASGGAGIYEAWQSVAAGVSEMTLLVGGEKMTHRETAETSEIISSLTHPVEYKHGVTLPAFGAMAARRYMHQFEVPRESLARVAVKNHANGAKNPNAQFQREITVETVLDSPLVADPLRLFDYCPVTDGAAALLVAPVEVAAEYTDEYVEIAGVAGATDTQVVHERPALSAMPAVTASGRQAFEMAGVVPDEIDVAELHDMVSVLEPLQLEALGFADRGDGWRQVETGRTMLDGALPINPSGGLKARGHPLGATGVAQAVEIYEQLLGRAGPRQVDANRGLATNVGGFGNCVVTTIMEAAQ